MDAYHILGYAGALLVGLILGVMGGGAALLLSPVLVYLFNINPQLATGYSFFIVGVTALIGAVQNAAKGLVDPKITAAYGLPSLIAVYCTRRFLLPGLPKTLLTVNGFTLTKNHAILFLLATVMLVAAYRLILDKGAARNESGKVNYVILAVYAVLIGVFLGAVGVGGGFLIVPALVYFANLNLKKAVGTSLVLVTINAFIGFMGDIHSHYNMDWQFLFLFTGISITGLLGGTYLSNFIDNKKLKVYFGWFVLFAAVWIVVKETLMN